MNSFETIGNWIHCEGIFDDTDYDQANKLGLEKEQELTLVPFRFNIKRVETYHEGSELETTVRFKSGFGITLNIPFEEFDNFMKKRLNDKMFKDKQR